MEIKRAVVSLAMLLAAYLIYAALVVPFIEPPAPKRMRPAERVGQSSPSAANRYQSELKGLFPPQAWENESPKILRIRNILVLFQDYQPQDDGTLRVYPCTAVVIDDRSTEETRRASSLILQAPKGAVLQLERPPGARSTQIGQPVGGMLHGPVRIFCHGRPDGTGRLNVVTSDVQISPEMILTPQNVEFEYERSRARGRDFMIKLLPLTNNRSIDRTQGWAGIRSIELVHLEHLHLEIEERANDEAPEAAPTPVDIVCRGPLRIDFVASIVTLEEQVELRRQTTNELIDTLHCEKLTLHLRQLPAAEHAASEDGRDDDRLASLPELDVARVVAEGDPVILDAPSRGAHVRSRRLMYDLEQGRFQLWAAPDVLSDHVLLRYGRQQLWARQFDCWLDGPRGVKQLRATGPGRFAGELTGTNPQPVQADWLAEMVFEREGELHRLTLDRGAEVHVGTDNGIQADVIHLWLEPAPQALAGNDRDSGSDSERPELALRPQRVVAIASDKESDRTPVQLWARGIVARIDQFEAQFQHLPDTLPAAEDSRGPLRPATDQGTPRVEGARILPASIASPASATFDRPAEREARVAARTLSATLRVRGQQVTVDNLLLDENVHIQQYSLDEPNRALFDLRADAVRMQDPSARQMHRLTAVGRPVAIESESLRMQTVELHLDQAENVVWTERPGSMFVLIDRDPRGRPLPSPQEMAIEWAGNMTFNGLQARFAGAVSVRSAQQRMRGETLDVQLTQPVLFGRTSSGARPEIRQIDVDGNVQIEMADYENQQLLSIARLQVPYARIDRQSGDLYASGPGRLTTVRAGFRSDLTSPAAPLAAPAPTDAESSDVKTYLQVDYQREITGNIYRNVVDFTDRVQVIYGPVLSWNETLSVQGPLRRNDVLLSCDRLTVAQATAPPVTAAARQPMIDLIAQGNTYVEGQSFTARGDRVSYAQAKGLLVLEGTGRTDAVLSHQSRIGAPRSDTAARKILYWIHTGRAEIADGRMIDLSNLGQ